MGLIFPDVDDMVLPYFLFGLFCDPFHLKLIFFFIGHDGSDGVSHILLTAFLFEDADDFGSREYEPYFFHEEESEWVLVGVDIFYKTHVESHHCVEKFFCEVVAVEEFL